MWSASRLAADERERAPAEGGELSVEGGAGRPAGWLQDGKAFCARPTDLGSGERPVRVNLVDPELPTVRLAALDRLEEGPDAGVAREPKEDADMPDIHHDDAALINHEGRDSLYVPARDEALVAMAAG